MEIKTIEKKKKDTTKINIKISFIVLIKLLFVFK